MSVDAIFSAINEEHAARIRAAHDSYETAVKPARAIFQDVQRRAQAKERADLADADKWRAAAIKAACPGRKPTASEIVSVTRTVTTTGAQVSLPRIGFIERQRRAHARAN